MLPLKTRAPDFSLPDTVSGKIFTRASFAGQPLLVVFVCNHCPFVKHLRTKLAEVGQALIKKGIGVVAISSNDVSSHPEDSPEKMALEAEEAGYAFPYLYDETQSVAKAYQAACTPDFFLFDREHQLAYRGQFDDSRPGSSIPVTGKDLMAAAELLLKGDSIPTEQKPSLGCNIKWKPGNEPAYYR
jgi:peroxiredoxin